VVEEPESVAAAVTVQSPLGLGRDKPVPLTRPFVVESPKGRLEIRVLKTYLDAYGTVQDYSRFNEPPRPGHKYVLVRVRATNVAQGGAPALVWKGDFSLLDGEGRDVGPSPVFVHDRLLAELSNRQSTEGEVVFEVARDQRGLVLAYNADYLGLQRYYFAVGLGTQ
jgi:hypothetical protein